MEAAALVEEMHYLSRWFQSQNAVPNPQGLVAAIDAQLDSVRVYLSRRFGASPTSILGHLEAAEAELLRLAPLPYVRSYSPNLAMQARRALRADDLQLIRLESLAKKAESAELTEDDRETIVACLIGAREQVRRTHSRLESFRNVVLATSSFLVVLALVLGLIGLLRPTLLPICFVNTSSGGQPLVACPAGQSSPFSPLGGQPGEPAATVDDIEEAVQRTVSPLDIPFVEFVGLLGAALAAAFAIKNIRGSSDPYSIPVALAFLKLPTGALTALIGLVLIRAGLVPGITTLDSSAQIIAWALVFGYAQQVVTGVVDRQARSVLEQSDASGQLLPFRSSGIPE